MPKPAKDPDQSDMESYFAFRARKAPTLYGFGTAAEADAYCELLNEAREINAYTPYPTNADDEADNHGLADLDGAAINLADALAADRLQPKE